MALIQCPECGQSISDKAVKCPKCGYPMGAQSTLETTPVSTNTPPIIENTTPISTVDENPNNGDWTTTKKSPKLISMLIAGAIMVVAVAVIIGSIALRGRVSVQSMDISKWKLTDAGTYGDNYEGVIVSDETSPFIAVIGSYEDENDAPLLAYMENGKGILQTYESSDDDPSVQYVPIGYIGGKIIKNSDISSINYKDNDYNDWNNDTSCTVDIDIELKSKDSGLLFVELRNDLTKEVEYNCSIVVVNGEGHYSYYLSDLPLKSRGVEVVAIPKYFCAAKSIKEKDYTVEKEFSVEKNEGKYTTSFSGTEELAFEDYDDGFIIYTKTLTEGGKKESRGQVINAKSFLHDGNCTISTYDYDDADSKILTPKYDIDIIGYLTWSTLE